MEIVAEEELSEPQKSVVVRLLRRGKSANQRPYRQLARQCTLMARVYIRASGQYIRRLLQLRSPVPCAIEGVSTRQSQDR